MTTGAPVLAVRGACVDYGRARALHDVTLTIEGGEFVGIIGPNGAGKSTLLKAALGLVPLRSGTVSLFGERAPGNATRTRIGYVPQNASQVDAQFPATAFEVALLGRVARRGLFRWTIGADRAKANRALDEVGMASLSHRLIGTLSGGERQRVLLAKALAGDPELLILDEPTTGVDPEARVDFYELLDHLNHDHGITVVLVSHDTDAIAESAHRLVAINRRVLFDGTPAKFRDVGGAASAFRLDISHGRRERHAAREEDGRP